MMAESGVIRVLLADDHPALRMGLRVLLDRAVDITVVGEASDGEAAKVLLESLQPDVAVLDCQLPGIDGVALTAWLRETGQPTRVVALSAYDDDRYMAGMLEAGALGYLLKNEAPGSIVAAVRAAAQGSSLWTGDQTARTERWRSEVARVRESLTEREAEVLHHLANGLSNKEIAQALSITLRTTDFHVSNILRKLGALSRVEAALWARDHLH